MFTWILTSVLLMLNLCLWIGNICNGMLLGNASIARGLTCCKKLARHEASRKSLSTKFPLGGEVNHIWPLAYIQNLNSVVLPYTCTAKRCRRNGEQLRPWSHCSSRNSVIWVYTNCRPLRRLLKMGVRIYGFLQRGVQILRKFWFWGQN